MKIIPTQPDTKTLATEMKKPCLIPLAFTKDHLENPAETYLNIKKRYKTTYLLESTEGPKQQSRYSVIGCQPLLYLKKEVESLELDGIPSIVENSQEKLDSMTGKTDELDEIRTGMLVDEMKVLGLNLPRYVLGITGYLGYDYIRSVIDLDEKTIDDLNHPIFEFVLPSSVIVFDHHEERTYYAALMLLSEKRDFEEVYSKSLERLDQLLSQDKSRDEIPEKDKISVHSNFEKKDFEESVERVKEYITQGDVIQTVISRRLELDPIPNLDEFYLRLREINSSPYMFFLDFPSRTIVGSSPEALVRVKERTVLTRPIAGTRRRGKNQKEDLEMERSLLRDQKERAEHIMLVDLGRNDIGRVAEFGSVEVPQFMEVEKYGDVQHIVSTVKGELREGKDAFDALRAVFPAGTVTGAPKVRSMEIIEELEPTQRGIYSGAVGSFSYSGDADFAIAIRTLTSHEDKAHIQVGAGIVADSIPEKEYYETENKARSLLRAAGVVNESSGD